MCSGRSTPTRTPFPLFTPIRTPSAQISEAMPNVSYVGEIYETGEGEGGCICCAGRGDFITVLHALLLAREEFDHIIVRMIGKVFARKGRGWRQGRGLRLLALGSGCSKGRLCLSDCLSVCLSVCLPGGHRRPERRGGRGGGEPALCLATRTWPASCSCPS